jgi:hypothetical protein
MNVTIELMDEHLVHSANVESMIQAFMANLARDITNLTENSSFHAVSLEELLYQIFVAIEG